MNECDICKTKLDKQYFIDNKMLCEECYLRIMMIVDRMKVIGIDRKGIDKDIKRFEIQIKALNKYDKELFAESKELRDQLIELDYDIAKKRIGSCLL